MDSNPYAAPSSAVEITTAPLNHRFYVASPTKFLIMYLGTMGIYEIYWVYKHWAQFKAATKGDQWPVMRALFPIFFYSFTDQRNRIFASSEWLEVRMESGLVCGDYNCPDHYKPHP